MGNIKSRPFAGIYSARSPFESPSPSRVDNKSRHTDNAGTAGASAGAPRHPIAAARKLPTTLDTYLHRTGINPRNARYDKRTWMLPHTRVYTSGGKAYELHNKITYGQGSYGKVRTAYDPLKNEVVAVKKFYPYAPELAEPGPLAQHEFNNRKLIGDGPYFLNLLGIAHAYYPHGNWHVAQCDQKSYIFMDLILRNGHSCDGLMRAREIKSADRWPHTRSQARTDLRDTAYQYLAAIAELHRKKLYYPDVKLSNFLHADAGLVKLCDYGLLHKDINHRGLGGTYNPPEFSHPEGKYAYRADKHDAFCLGIALFQLVRASYALPEAITVTATNDGNHHLPALKVIGNHKTGFIGTDRLPGNTIEEVAAKLMDIDPKKRPSPAQALTLPYFTSHPISDHIPRFIP